jgi:rhodanese-related sulfurtransferase
MALCHKPSWLANTGMVAPIRCETERFAPAVCVSVHLVQKTISCETPAVGSTLFLCRRQILNLKPYNPSFSALENMENPQEILARARERAQKMNLPYAGALLPAEAHALMQNLHEAKLVDVRTRAELEWVGSVPGSAAVEWNAWPGGARNPDFVAQLEQQVDKAATVMFLCRSGGRSNAAAIAAMQAGYGKAYNVLEGFEGDKDVGGQRNKLGGWRAAGLPWTQS